ncbi:MAG: IS200/IS605 family transposase [Bacteroidetes bacterium]|nr:MAG: IS200/IS605 family transposase [Bacteroidota bacterium]
MANTYTQVYVHLVFVVEGRQNLITKKYKENLNKYITGIIQNRGHKLIIINGMQDHIHILIGLSPDESISGLVHEVKRCATNFINDNNYINGKFRWQKGYAAFSYSKSNIDNVYNYIKNQEIHHKERTFKEEYMELLKKFDIKFDEKYIFEDVI